MRCHQKAECALVQKDRNASDANRLKRSLYKSSLCIRSICAFVSLLFLRIVRKRSSSPVSCLPIFPKRWEDLEAHLRFSYPRAFEFSMGWSQEEPDGAFGKRRQDLTSWRFSSHYFMENVTRGGSPSILVKDELIKRFLPRIVCTRSDLGPMKNNSAVPDSPKTVENPRGSLSCSSGRRRSLP